MLHRPANSNSAQPLPEPRAEISPAVIASHPARFCLSRNALFVTVVALALLIFWMPLSIILGHPIWTDNAYDKYCYTVIVPFLSLILVFLDRRVIFSSVRYCFGAGTILFAVSIFLRLFAGQIQSRIGVDNSLIIEILGLVVFWIGGFILCFGTSAFRAGTFPLLLLLLTVPVPGFLLNELIVAVQHGSADVCSFIFGLFRVPVLKNGLVFSLPDVSIEVEKVCSGIHSTMATLLVSIIIAHLFITRGWKKVLLILAAVPIVCVTNGFRIALLTLLAQYVDRSFLYGRLHHQGGVLFFALALLLLYLVLRLLRIGDPKRGAVSSSQETV